jgi:hypothetical protein
MVASYVSRNGAKGLTQTVGLLRPAQWCKG